MRYAKQQAFTLVELIVVITILGILGTISFLSFQGYSGSARNATRSADLSNLSKSIEMSSIGRGSYPEPINNIITVTYSGAIVWKQGTVDSNFIQQGGMQISALNDPLTKKSYTYAKTVLGKSFQVYGIYETETAYNPMLIDTAYAGANDTAIILGTLTKPIALTSTGGQTCLLAIPSLIIGDTSSATYDYFSTSNKLYYNKKALTGVAYTPTVSCATSLPKTTNTINSAFTTLKNAFTTSSVKDSEIVGEFVSKSSAAEITAYGIEAVKSLGVKDLVTNSGVNGACGTANGQTLANSSSITGAGACSAGSLSGGVLGSGPWTWTCAGSGGGTDASCSANAQLYVWSACSATNIDIGGSVASDVQIGTQCWLSKNMNVGNFLASATSAPGSATTLDKWCPGAESATSSTTADCTTYGALYGWNVAMQGAASSNFGTAANGGIPTDPKVKGICPTGYHIPSQAEMTALYNYLSGIPVANVDDTLRTTYSFTPGGHNFYLMQFTNRDLYGEYWTSTQYDAGYARFRTVKGCPSCSTSFLTTNSYASKTSDGKSVRCLKD